MNKTLFQLDRKGVSIMVGYVILIALAIGLSIGVFLYLKLYLPPEDPKCPDNVAVTIDEVTCDISGNSATVNINLTNRGFFTVDSAFIKIGDAERVLKTTINEPDDRLSSECNNQGIGLKPEERYCGENLIYPNPQGTVQEVTVEPLIYIENEPVLCSERIAKKSVVCS